jgi:hypothetical protein
VVPPAEAEPEPPPEPEPKEPESFAEAFGPGARRILRHARLIAGSFFGSWLAAYVGSRLELDVVYYGGLGGGGLTMVVVLIWLSP